MNGREGEREMDRAEPRHFDLEMGGRRNKCCLVFLASILSKLLHCRYSVPVTNNRIMVSLLESWSINQFLLTGSSRSLIGSASSP